MIPEYWRVEMPWRSDIIEKRFPDKKLPLEEFL